MLSDVFSYTTGQLQTYSHSTKNPITVALQVTTQVDQSPYSGTPQCRFPCPTPKCVRHLGVHDSLSCVMVGSSPITAAKGVAPVFLVPIWFMSTRAAAPSFRVLELAAVTVPPSSAFTNAGFKEGNLEKSTLQGVGEKNHNIYKRRCFPIALPEESL